MPSFDHFLFQRSGGSRDPTAVNFSQPVRKPRGLSPHVDPAACCCWTLWPLGSQALFGLQGGTVFSGDGRKPAKLKRFGLSGLTGAEIDQNTRQPSARAQSG